MDHEMRRKDRVMSKEMINQIIDKSEYGVLASISKDFTPLATPLSYVKIDGYLYFHCAMVGHKIDNFNFNNNVTFTIVTNTKPVYDNSFTTYYQSVMIKGIVEEVKDKSEKAKSLRLLCEKYLPNEMQHFSKEMQESFHETAVFKISMDKVTGKEKR